MTSKKKYNILMADGDPVLRSIATMAMAAHGYHVTEAATGSEAIDIIRKQPIDLALIDLGIPVKDGFEVVRSVRATAATSHFPIVVVAGRDDMVAVKRAFSLGATFFVTKPIDWSLLVHHLEFILRASSMEDELRMAKRAAEQANIWQSRLLSLISHEFRTPLHLISGFSTLLGDLVTGQPGQPDAAAKFDPQRLSEISDYASQINQATARLNGLLGDIMLMSDGVANGLETLEEEYNTHGLIKSALDKVAAKARQTGCRLVFSSGLPRDSEFLCDRKLFVTALVKLLDNALKFSPRGGRIEVSAGFASSGEVVFRVKDAGRGMSAEQLQKVQAPFVQADMSKTRSSEGLGLGLAIVRLVADAHAGRLILRSRPDQGTEAFLVMPRKRLICADAKRHADIAEAL